MEARDIETRRVRMWLRMLRTTNQIENALREYLRVNYNTTLPRFDVLAALERQPDGMKMSELSQQLLVSNGNATAIIIQLEKLGHVERWNAEHDRRVVFVKITPKGKTFFNEAAAGHRKKLNAVLGQLDGDDLDLARDYFHRLEASIKEERKDNA